MTPEILVPLQLFIDAQQKGYAKKLQFFLSLKLLYKCGKAKLDDGELLFLELTEEISSRKTTMKYLAFLVKKGWLRYNSKTGYYIISFVTHPMLKNIPLIDISEMVGRTQQIKSNPSSNLMNVYWKNGTSFNKVAVIYNENLMEKIGLKRSL